MKKYTLLALTGGMMCSVGFAAVAPDKALSAYAAPPVSSMIKNNEFMVAAEWLSLSSEGENQGKDVESMTGYRLQYSRNFGVESTGFWSAGISWGQSWGSGDRYDLTTNSLRFGIDRNFKVGSEGLYAFIGGRVGMTQTIIRFDQRFTVNGKNPHCYDNASELGIGAGVKYYFPKNAGSLTAGVLYMWRNGTTGYCNNSGISVTTIYAGYSFAF